MELFHTDTDYSILILGVFPLDQIAHVGVSPSMNLELISHEIIFEVFQNPTYVITVRKRYRRTDDILWHHRRRRSIAR